MTLPISLEQARAQLKAETDEQDDEIRDFISDAAGWVERYTGHILEARTVEETFCGFRPVSIRAWPLLPATVPTITYTGPDGATVTENARLDVAARPGRVMPAVGAFWPFRDSGQRFTVSVRAGYEDPADVPGNLRRAMLVLIGAYDADREGGKILADAEASARRLCQRFKRHTL